MRLKRTWRSASVFLWTRNPELVRPLQTKEHYTKASSPRKAAFRQAVRDVLLGWKGTPVGGLERLQCPFFRTTSSALPGWSSGRSPTVPY